jgi:hypothetical protein
MRKKVVYTSVTKLFTLKGAEAIGRTDRGHNSQPHGHVPTLCDFNEFTTMHVFTPILQTQVIRALSGSKIFETSYLPGSGIITRLDPGHETSAPN